MKSDSHDVLHDDSTPSAVSGLKDRGILETVCSLSFCQHRIQEQHLKFDSQPLHGSHIAHELWDQIRHLGWGASLAQIELMRRMRNELFNLVES
jgi:hypothetical protein